MQAILGFVPDHALRSVDDFGGDFFAAMRGQAVHEQRIFGGQTHEFGIDLERGERLRARGLFLFLAHAGPDIGDDQIGAACGGGRVVADFGMIAGAGDDIRRRVRNLSGAAMFSLKSNCLAAPI